MTKVCRFLDVSVADDGMDKLERLIQLSGGRNTRFVKTQLRKAILVDSDVGSVSFYKHLKSMQVVHNIIFVLKYVAVIHIM